MEKPIKELTAGELRVMVYRTRNEMGRAAGEAAGRFLANRLQEKAEVSVIFAAAPSQNEMLDTLVCYPGIDWSRIHAFHMDEYIGLAPEAPQGFGNFLKRHIFARLPFRSVNYLNGGAADLAMECARYAALLQEHPSDLVLMGIGENGHIAFNDPWVADFHDNVSVKVVELDSVCRMQQVNDGCFEHLDEVPTHALTLTIPALIQAEGILCTVPAPTKRRAVARAVLGPVETACPASILQTRRGALLFCDADSGADLMEIDLP